MEKENLQSFTFSNAAELGQVVRTSRKAQNMTQADAAVKCGVGVRFLSELENGKPTAELGKVLKVLNSLNGANSTPVHITEQATNTVFQSERLEKSAASSHVLQQESNKAIIDIATHKHVVKGEFNLAAKYITEKIAKFLNVDFAAIWLFNDDQTTLRCLDIYDLRKNNHHLNLPYTEEENPTYFTLLRTDRIISSNDLSTDSRFSDYENLYKPHGITGLLDATIRVSGKVIGTVTIEHCESNREWSSQEISFCCEIADQLTQTMLNKRHRDYEKAQEERLKQLKKLQNAILFIATHDSIIRGDISKAAQVISKTAAECLDVIDAGVWLFSDNKHQLYCIDSYNNITHEHTTESDYNKQQYPEYFKQIEQQRTLVINDAATDLRTREFDIDALYDYKHVAMLDSSIRVSGKISGIISIERNGENRTWTNEEVAFNAELADQMAQVIVNFERRNSESERKAQVTRSLKQQAAIAELAIAASIAEGDINSTIQIINELVCRTLNTCNCSVYFLNAEKDLLIPSDAYKANNKEHYTNKSYKRSDHQRYFQAIESEITIASTHARINPKTSSFRDSYYIPKNIYSSLDASIRVSGKTIGVITSDHDKKPREWEADETAFISAIADQIALCIINDKHQRAESAEKHLVNKQEEIQSIINNSQFILFSWAKGHDWTVDYVSNNIQQFGYSPEELYNKEVCFRDIIVTEDLLRIQQEMKGYDKDIQCHNYHLEYRIITKGGDTRWIDEHTRIIRDSDNNIERFHCVAHDITARKRDELSLRMLSSAVEQSGSSVLITGKKGIIEYVNSRFTEMTGYTAQEAIGQYQQSLLLTNMPRDVLQELRKTTDAGQDWRGELINTHKDGSQYWTLLTVSPIQDQNSETTHFISVSEDVTEIKKNQEKMEQLAFYDTLTGLENRRLFKERLEKATKLAQRNNTQVALLYLDLDQFKLINDTMGHDAGDTLLKSAAKRIKSSVRENDSVARLGGDEFTVLLTEIDGISGADAVARKILKSLRRPIKLGNQEITITVSIGITLSPNDSVIPNVLMKYADLAMYRAKSIGRNNYQFFTEEMNIETSERMFIENELRRSLEKEEFSLRYQPIICLESRKVIGVEALIRWQHPIRGTISPIQFISIAEDTGIIVELGKWVLKKSANYIKNLHKSGFPDIKVAVNLSVVQFKDTQFIPFIKELLEETALPANCLELEITESMLMNNVEESINTLNAIKALGISISIDDFGTGYSSLSYLKRLPIDNIKIDRSFVEDIPHDTNDLEITAAVIAMAHKLNLKVVAEGVQNKVQEEFLHSNNCNYVQGFYYSRGVSGEKLGTVIKKINNEINEELLVDA